MRIVVEPTVIDRGRMGQKRSCDFRGRNVGRGGRDKSRVRCFNCLSYGHFAAECKRPKRDKEQGQNLEANLNQVQDDDEPALLLTECGKEGEKVKLLNEERVVPKLKQEGEIRKVESNLWYLDNGVSNHMTGDKMKFNELNEQITGQVKFGDGSMVKIEGKGSIMLKCKNGEERTLREVYYIPSLCNNINSIGQLSEEGNKAVFNEDLPWVHD
ncbi:hypothetical protein AgCh_035122 [Apium graveolens]